MNTCSTCAHWYVPEHETDREFSELGFKQCAAVKMRETIKEAEFAPPNKPVADSTNWQEVERIENAALVKARAFVCDGSSYFAALRTGPDFGCLLHEEAKA